eukprot:612298-Pyramimonas_sp.AAC.1
MINLIEDRINKLLMAFNHRRKPTIQLHAASHTQGPEAQNQSEISSSRLATAASTPSRQTYGSHQNADATEFYDAWRQLGSSRYSQDV